MWRFLSLLAVLIGLTTPVFAQNTIENARAISALCRFGAKADPTGCALLRNTLGLPPVSLMRFMSGNLYRARTEARSSAARTEADALFTGWLDTLGVGRQVRQSILGNDAGILLESAWIARLRQCEQGTRTPCAMLRGNDAVLFNRTRTLLRQLYPEHARVIEMLDDVPI